MYNITNTKNISEEDKLHQLLFSDSQTFVNKLDTQDDDDDHETDSDNEEPEEKKIKRDEHAAWHDDDDDKIQVKDALHTQGRHLPNGGINSYEGKYAKLVEEKYKLLVGTPKWANITKNYEDDSDEELLQDFGYTAKTKKLSLPKESLECKRLKYLNNSTKREGPIIRAVDFHPTSTVALVGGDSGVVSLVAVDGKNHEKLHSVYFKEFPIHSAQFTVDGKRAYVGSAFSHIYSYDLMQAKSTRILLPDGITKMCKFRLSPCGKYLAIKGRFGQIHILCAETWEFIHTLKQNSTVGALDFNSDGSKLYSHGTEGLVTVWNMATRRAMHKFVDDGCVAGSSLTLSKCNKYIATGSAQGVVNVYDVSRVLETKDPKPRKSFMNLTTKITELKFNPSTEMLFFASEEKQNAMKIAHIPSFEVFPNFPGTRVDLGYCSVSNFSPNGGYFAFGTNKRVAFLYRLKHYSDY